jgi:integrase
MYVRFMWQKELFKLYKDRSDRPHSYATALHDLATINQQIQEKAFDPKDWLPAAIQEKRFENAMDSWIARKEKEAQDGKLAPSTLGNYQTYRKKYYVTSEHLAGVDVRDVRLKHLQLFYDGLPGSAKYRKNVMDGLYTFFRWLKRWGDIKEVPTWPEVETPIQHEPFTLVEEAQIDVLSMIPIEHRDIFEFLMETGLRPSEACALMAKDIDPQTRKALIRRTYSEAELREKTKQKKERWVVLTDRTWELVTKNAGRSEFVFTNPDTKRGYRYKFLYRLWTETGTKVGFYAGTRHSLGTQLGNAGVPIQDIQKILGHADLRSTQRYVHPSDERTRELLSRRGKIISIEEAKKK